MDLLTQEIRDKATQKVIHPAKDNEFGHVAKGLLDVYQEMHQNIPDKKRISYGTYYTIKTLGGYLYNEFEYNGLPAFEIANQVLGISGERKVTGIAICIVSHEGLNNLNKTLPFFEKYAAHENWEVREFAAGFIHKLTKKYPSEVKKFYLRLVKSDNPNTRRFVSESLRPVSENRWMLKEPDYSLSIIKHLYNEKEVYPRTSVGNHLSDFARQWPEMVFKIVAELANNGDKNSYWIAYRACRNLVKKEPIRVMDLLRTDEYKYKTRIHKRADYD